MKKPLIMSRYILLLTVLSIFSCKQEVSQQTKETKALKVGTYRALLEVQDDELLPFIFEVVSKDELKIYNAEEIIEVDEILYKNDSVFITTPVFEGYIAAAFKGDNLQGSFIKESLNRVVPFAAEYGELGSIKRFETSKNATSDVTGIWETTFSPGIEGDAYIAKGIFKQTGNSVTGTFRTTTGDYRYLEGTVDGETMKLSTFDGAHAFLFTAKVTDTTLEGTFYSGNHWKEPFIAKRNADYELPSANELTFLKEGYDSIDFTFPNTSDELVGLKDDRFKDKVVVVQIMGTWCPNCLDESKYYADYYKKNKDKDIEFIALAFEYAKDKESAFSRIDRLASRINIEYPILLAQYGSSSKVKANEKLPMLNHVLSYPTSIFIDKKGIVRKIHTGFNGPATGEKYVEFKAEFESFLDLLLSE